MPLMWPFKSTPTPTPLAVPNVAPESSSRDFASLSELKQLETRVKQLELTDAERQLAVMNALEKVMYQLRAREDRRRAREEEDVEEEQPELEFPLPARARQVGDGRMVEGSAQLAKRFRRW